MYIVAIDREECTQCGLCIEVCGRGCLGEENGIVTVLPGAANCHACGHCVAICPSRAIAHLNMDMNQVRELERKEEMDFDRLVYFLKRRRSHRFFLETPVPREKLETLIDVARFAPTGSNVQAVEILVVSKPAKLHELSALTVDYFRKTIARVQQECKRITSNGLEMPSELRYAKERLPHTERLIQAWDSGRNVIFHEAKVVMVFHSTPFTSTPKDNCVIAAHTVALTAMTLGLETCYIGLLEMAANGSPEVIRALGLPESNKVYSVLILGYPRYRYLRTVDRLPIRVTWK